MIEKLKEDINETIIINYFEPNKWIIYGRCKQVLQDYEMQNKSWFNIQDWAEYINYITDKLEI